MDGPIKASVITMNHHRQIWNGLGEVLRANPSLPESAWWEHYFNVYAETQRWRSAARPIFTAT